MATKGEARRDAILASARKILTRDGAHGFRLRAIAAEADIGLSHVQYYFASIEDLLAALVERYLAEWEERIATSANDLHALVDLVLDSQRVDDECQLLWELWAMSSHSPGANATLTSFYRAYVDRVHGFLPPLSDRATAESIVALIEGMSVLHGFGNSQNAASVSRARLHQIIDSVVQSRPA